MSLHVIVGAGPIGSTTALLLAETGNSVRLVTRSGGGPIHPGIEHVAANATDVGELRRVVAGATTLYNCANPQYHQWNTDWPPLAASLLATAERTGAVLVTMSNLYGYGPVDHPMSETDPLAAVGRKGRIRAGMWANALAAHRTGRVRVAEARASDYFGPGVLETAHLGARVFPRLLEGQPARIIGDPDAPHSWTYVPDVARALVVLGADERGWGKAWHVPSNPPLSRRAVLAEICRLSGAPSPKVRAVPRWVLSAGGLVSPMLRELGEVFYQFDRPFVVDSSAFSRTFGQQPTPMDEALLATIAWWRDRARIAA